MIDSFVKPKKNTIGTIPVFLITISTILGAILFLRLGWAVGNSGLLNVIGMIILGHMITIPTAFAIAEIATNQKVQGGGTYYIISRSFGLRIGAAIGMALYLSQAISIAFYIIAFSEAFTPLLEYLNQEFNLILLDKRVISIPTMGILAFIMLKKQVTIGMNTLFFIAVILFGSILLFFIGKPATPLKDVDISASIMEGKSFFQVFKIIFPAFTGLAAGLGLARSLKNPTKSIPEGTLYATFGGFIIYIFVAIKLTFSASPAELSADYLIMQNIAYWGPAIPIGLAVASIASAIGSFIVANKTLQFIGQDNVFPNQYLNSWLSKGKSFSNISSNAIIVSTVIAILFLAIGELDFVAEIITMLFLLTYGTICTISVLEHFAADPSYRPTFRSRWYISLAGGLLSFWLMFKINWEFTTFSLTLLAVFYHMSTNMNLREKSGLVKLFRGVLFQLSRQLQIATQRVNEEDDISNWRPFVLCISQDSFKRRSAFDFLRWISYKYGFGTYIHYMEGYLSKASYTESKEIFDNLVKLAKGTKNRVYLNTIISPSYTSAIAQVIQLPGISGRGNNMMLFEFSRSEPGSLADVLNNYSLLQTTGFDVCILNTGYKGFGYKKDIHVWITSQDYDNANLMILIAYILLGHPEWEHGIIKIFALYKSEEIEEKSKNLISIIKAGRLPISLSNVQLIPAENISDMKKIISKYSLDADLTIVGFRSELIKPKGIELFTGFEDVGNILFVNSNKEKEIK